MKYNEKTHKYLKKEKKEKKKQENTEPQTAKQENHKTSKNKAMRMNLTI